MGLLLCALAAPASAQLPAPPAPSQPGPVPLALPELMRVLAAVPRRQGRFVEEKHLAALAQPLVVHGTLGYVRPSHLEKISEQPFAERLVVDGDRVTLGDQSSGGQDSAGSGRSMDIGSQPEIKALVDTVRGTLAGDLPVLQSHYNVTLEGSLAAWRLTLLPNEARLAQFIRVVRIDGAGSEPRVIETVQMNGDWQRMTIDPSP